MFSDCITQANILWEHAQMLHTRLKSNPPSKCVAPNYDGHATIKIKELVESRF